MYSGLDRVKLFIKLLSCFYLIHQLLDVLSTTLIAKKRIVQARTHRHL
jgi:hypothetical protein